MNLNEAKLIGRVVRDPELRTTPGGAQVVSLSIATNHSWKDASGSKQETTQFHNCVAWNKLAELIAKYVTKGQELYVCGRIEYRSWESKEGQKRERTEIIIDDFQFGAKPKGTAEKSAGEAILDSAKPGAHGDMEVRLEDVPF
ncbi:MAG: single-stranded DNA-binding protein [Undibacterium sp.]